MNHADIIEFAEIAAASGKGKEYHVSAQITGGYPFWDSETSEAQPAVASVYTMSEPSGAKGHNVVLAFMGDDNYAIWCGDNFIENGDTKIPVEDRIKMAVDEMTNVPQAEATARLRELRGAAPASTGCHFWSNFKKNGTLCKHCNRLLSLNRAQLPTMLQELQERFESDILGQSTAPAMADTLTELEEDIQKVPVLLEGDKGWGKTREARVLATRLNAELVEIHGHESVESADLTGHTVRYGHDMVWKDGRLSEAFRKASKGARILLLVDECLRVPQKQLSVFLSALSPHEDEYRLATGRIINVVDGIGTEETLVCSVNNLLVIATTNVGVQYAVDLMDPALQERFLVKRKELDVGVLRDSVNEFAVSKGFSTDVAAKCVAFFKAMMVLRPNGLVADVPNPRTMLRAVNLAKTEGDIKRSVLKQILTWVSRDVEGKPVQEQMDAVRKAVNSVWA